MKSKKTVAGRAVAQVKRGGTKNKVGTALDPRLRKMVSNSLEWFIFHSPGGQPLGWLGKVNGYWII